MSKVRPFVLGVTGGVGTGKSTVMEMLARLGVPGLSTDQVSHDAIRKGRPAFKKIVRHWGQELLGPDGEIVRSVLGQRVFSSAKERRWLERVLHPGILKTARAFVRQHRGIVALDIPLLFEARWEKEVDRILVVSAPAAVQRARLARRTGWTSKHIRQRIAAQWSLSKKRAKADYVLENAGSKSDLLKRVRAMLKILKGLA